MKAAIGSLDERMLSREQLEKIRANMPTAEEMEMIHALDGPEVRWDKPEEFLRTLMAIPRVKVRLRCWAIKYGFSERAAELDETLGTLEVAIKAVRTSQALPPILGALVALGNHLNGGTPKGRADGFALADLGKVSVTKDNANKESLLGYALHVLVESSAHSVALRLPEELAVIGHAKVKLSDVRATLQKLAGEAKELERSAAAPQGAATAAGEGAADDPFSRTMGRFSTQAAAETVRLTQQLDEAHPHPDTIRHMHPLSRTPSLLSRHVSRSGSSRWRRRTPTSCASSR